MKREEQALMKSPHFSSEEEEEEAPEGLRIQQEYQDHLEVPTHGSSGTVFPSF